MADPFLAEIRIFPYNFVPRGWSACNGQLIPISQNTALFALLGTNYGGDGRSTFALPDLRGRFPMGTGQGPGLSDRQLGEATGSETVTLTTAQLPSHRHALLATSTANTTNPSGAALANVATNGPAYRTPGVLAASASSLAPTGGNQPHENRQPALSLIFCIATQGIFPSRP
jgi:microcystin-dependent protein